MAHYCRPENCHMIARAFAGCVLEQAFAMKDKGSFMGSGSLKRSSRQLLT